MNQNIYPKYHFMILFLAIVFFYVGSSIAGNPYSPYGINMHTICREDNGELELYDRVAEAGIEWVRLEACWYAIQPKRPPALNSPIGVDMSKYEDWICIDRAIDEAHNHGLSIYLTISYTPKWDNHVQNCGECKKRFYENPDYSGYAAHAPAEDSGWGHFVRRVVNRYKEKVKYFGVWNEPNNEKCLMCCDNGKPAPKPNGACDHKGCGQLVYKKLLEGAYASIKSACPECKVVAPCTMDDDMYYLQDILEHCKEKDLVVVIAQNIYDDEDNGPGRYKNTFHEEFEKMKKRLKDVGIWGRMPVWITETGWETVYKHGQLADDPHLLKEQANRYDVFLHEFLELMKENYPHLERVFFYDVVNCCDRQGKIRGAHGLMKCADVWTIHDEQEYIYEPKPAYFTYMKFIKGHPFCPWVIDDPLALEETCCPIPCGECFPVGPGECCPMPSGECCLIPEGECCSVPPMEIDHAGDT